MKFISIFITVFLFYVFIIYLYKYAKKCSTADAKKMVNKEIAEFFSTPQPLPPPVAIVGQADMDEIARQISRFFDSIRYCGCKADKRGFIVYAFSVYGVPDESSKIIALKKIMENETAKYLVSTLYWDNYFVRCVKLIEGELLMVITDSPSGAESFINLEKFHTSVQQRQGRNIIERMDDDGSKN